MAEPIATAFVKVAPDMKTFGPEVSAGVHAAPLDDDGKKAGSRFGGAFGAAAGIAIATGAVAFGKSSIDAFKEAELAQGRLSDAFAKFPALADTNKAALDRYNTSLAQKTKFDDDAFASGQAVLAQFGLTGQQITDLTPLLADYAAKTGTDLPTAAEQLGKGLLGQGRALKSVGIDFQDAGSVGANFEQIMGGLRTQVGGFAEQEGKTAAGQSEILKNRFGELQETVGEKLIPILNGLAVAGVAVLEWIEKNNELVLAAVGVMGAFGAVLLAVKVATLAQAAASAIATAATGVWTAAQWLLNFALTANPLGIVVLAIAAFAAAVVLAYQKSETFRAIVQGAWQGIQAVVSFAWNSILQPIFSAAVRWFQDIWVAAQTFARVFNEAWGSARNAASAAWDWLSKNVVDPMRKGFDGVLGIIRGISDVVGTVVSAVNKINPFGGGGKGGLQSAPSIANSAGRAFPAPGGAGAYRVTQGPHPNNAIDYGMPTGTPLYASYSGLLTTTDLGNRSYGKYFRLSGQGTPILGAHLSSFARSSGAVSKGDLIGYSGSTGNSTGPHLHLENFDWGGLLRPGWNVVRNDTGKMERVVPSAKVGAGGGGVTVNVHVTGSVVTERDLVRAVRDGLGRLSGRGDPVLA